MKHKRLDRNGWGFQNFPYYQMRIDSSIFHGIICLIRLDDGKYKYREMPSAGKTAVAGAGMTWMELIPDGKKRVITVKYLPDGTHDHERKNYPFDVNQQYQPSICYVDVTDGFEYDEDGVIKYIDKYLDVIFSPEGDIKVDDRDELDEAYSSGELTLEQYNEAVAEGNMILKELCTDIPATFTWCANLRAIVEKQIEAGEKPLFLFHGSQYLLDVLKPMQAYGECEAESKKAIYAAKSAKEVIPFALPIRWYSDNPSGQRSFTCSDGKIMIHHGSLNPDGEGYVYKVSSKAFHKVDGWQWVSYEQSNPTAVLRIKVKDYLHLIEFSEEVKKINYKLYNEGMKTWSTES